MYNLVVLKYINNVQSLFRKPSCFGVLYKCKDV